jgi:preprotein translocase subunit Sec63
MDEEGFAKGTKQDQQARREACGILEVGEDADKQALKKAYTRACLKHHPDRNPNDKESHYRFLLVQCAYELLTRNTICRMLLEKMESQSPAPSKAKYNTGNPWGYFLWWREQFFDEF